MGLFVPIQKLLINFIAMMTSDVTAALVSNLLIGQDFATFYDSRRQISEMSVHREASTHIHRGEIWLFHSPRT